MTRDPAGEGWLGGAARRRNYRQLETLSFQSGKKLMLTSITVRLEDLCLERICSFKRMSLRRMGKRQLEILKRKVMFDQILRVPAQKILEKESRVIQL